MDQSAYYVLANNAALLLAMGVVYDATLHSSKFKIPFKTVISGIVLGLIGIALMSTPLPVSEGVIIDSRSILLSTTGLFFGWIPTAITVLLTVTYRLLEGGQGALAGVIFIFFSALCGLIWREVRKGLPETMHWLELYIFGLLVHVGMLLITQLLLPNTIASSVTQAISLPVMLIFPVATVLLCLLLSHQRSRREAETALRRSEETANRTLDQLKATLNAIPDLMFDLDIEGRYYGFHAADPGKLIIPGDQLTGRTVHDVMPPEAADAVVSALREAQKAGASHGTQIHLPIQNGSYCFELSVAPKQIVKGKLPRFIVLSRDITDRKRAEQELHIAATAFNSQEGMIITDEQHTILRVNRAFTEVTGYEAHEAIGKRPNLLQSGRHDGAFYRAMMDALARNRHWQGEIWNKRKNGEIYPEWLSITTVLNDQGKITNYVAAFTDITQRKQAEADIHTLAFYDALTGLPNRRLLHDRLDQALLTHKRRHKLGAVMFIDLDNFKTLNDTKGHDVGDALLIEVGSRLKNCVREVDTVARLGGDEFIIILEDLGTDRQEAAQNAEHVGEKIVAALNQPYPLQDADYQGSASVGVSLFNHEDRCADDLLKRADLAMYQAKESGRNALCFFDPEIQKALYAQAALEAELRCAVEQEQFELYYQMQTHRSELTGAEVLLRWHHPENGLVPPGQFIPIAEQSGLIVAIGSWVLKTACAQLKRWDSDPLLSQLTLSVNVSAKQFGQNDFVSEVESVLHRTGANPKRLKLEITESSVLIDVDDTAEKMAQLKQLGISFAIDDFGTGYSSLLQLKKLPVDQLKIDRSFVRDLTVDSDDLTIVQAIIALAHNLGIEIIAEGVETEAQRQCLEERQCDHFQGFLFGRPVPLSEFEATACQRTATPAL